MRQLEDLIFDMMDEESEGSTSKKVKAAEEAEEWLKSDWEAITSDDINAKYRQLRAMS